MNETRTDRCPLCGADNACAMARAGGDPAACEGCWCRDATIPESLIARVPGAARGRACICARCVSMEAATPAPGVRFTVDPGGRPAIELTHGRNRALIARLGAQVLSWSGPDGDALWTASGAAYDDGAPVRGGVPVVFPWFGDHAEDASKPAHGFARGREWTVVATSASSVTLAVRDDEQTRTLWPHEFSVELEVTLRDTLQVTMRVDNPSAENFTFEQALHTYFAVGDIQTASVRGLEGVPCTEHARAPEAGWDPAVPLRFRAETDRVFQGAPAAITLDAPALGREVTLTAPAARSAIVWNPWPVKAATLSQMAPDDWQAFCCVETANCKENAVTLAPGQRHQLTLTLRRAQR
ncbi:MAG: cysteine-rich CWC family protein [Planctomycetota bacterium]|nr:cysteine-rich CWC family protein [Planctomycetota bacterium]MEC9047844.1 cysteine-rich CWC family protein [Planctomycetota bacterium]